MIYISSKFKYLYSYICNIHLIQMGWREDLDFFSFHEFVMFSDYAEGKGGEYPNPPLSEQKLRSKIFSPFFPYTSLFDLIPLKSVGKVIREQKKNYKALWKDSLCTDVRCRVSGSNQLCQRKGEKDPLFDSFYHLIMS